MYSSTLKIDKTLRQKSTATKGLKPSEYRPISELEPNTYAHIKGQEFLELLLENERWPGNETSTRCLYFDGNSLLAAYISNTNLTYIDDQKNKHTTMSFQLFFDNEQVRNNFQTSVSSDIHIFPDCVNRYKHGVALYILTKTREAYLEVLNQIFSFPEAKPYAKSFFKPDWSNRLLVTSMNITMQDIKSLRSDVEHQTKNSQFNKVFNNNESDDCYVNKPGIT